MGTLSYTATISLDGFVNDADSDFRWSAPSAEVFAFHVERMTDVSTEVLGRRTYELMRYWEVEPADETWSEAEQSFARRWQGLQIVVASATLEDSAVTARRARLVRDLGLDELARIVAEAPGEVEIFGPTTAAAAIRAGMVRDFRFFVAPQVLGGGLPALPAQARLHLQLVEQRTFADGTVFVHYQHGCDKS